MKRPEQLGLLLSEIVHEHLQVAVMPMQIMKMNDIRLNAIQLRNNLSGRFRRVEPIVAQNPRTERLKLWKRLCALNRTGII